MCYVCVRLPLTIKNIKRSYIVKTVSHTQARGLLEVKVQVRNRSPMFWRYNDAFDLNQFLVRLEEAGYETSHAVTDGYEVCVNLRYKCEE